MRDIIVEKLDRMNIDKKIEGNKKKNKKTIVEIIVPPNQLNYAIGNNRCNKKYLEEKDVCYIKFIKSDK